MPIDIKQWFRDNMSPILTRIKTPFVGSTALVNGAVGMVKRPLIGDVGRFLGASGNWEDVAQLPQFGVYSNTFNVPLVQGIYIFSGTANAILPPATGSGRMIVLSCAKIVYRTQMEVTASGSDKINNHVSQFYMPHNSSIVLIDNSSGQWTTDSVLMVEKLALHVPGDYKSIQDALDATKGFRTNRGRIDIVLKNGDYNIKHPLRCFHPEKIRIGGVDNINYVYHKNGNYNGNYSTCLAALPSNAPRLICDNTTLDLSSFPNFSFINTQIVCPDPSAAPQDLIVLPEDNGITNTFESVIILGGVHGIRMEQAANRMMFKNVRFLHQGKNSLVAKNSALDLDDVAFVHSFIGLTAERCSITGNVVELENSYVNLRITNSDVVISYPKMRAEHRNLEQIGGTVEFVTINQSIPTFEKVTEFFVSNTNPNDHFVYVLDGRFTMKGDYKYNITFKGDMHDALYADYSMVDIGLPGIGFGHCTFHTNLGINAGTNLVLMNHGHGIHVNDTDLVPMPPLATNGNNNSMWVN